MDFQPIFMAGYSLKDRDSSHWEQKVRPSVVPAEQPRCSICGFIALEKRSLIHADEVWAFPRPPNVILIDVRPLCVRCHDAKDYAHLLIRIRSGSTSQQREAEVRRHYCDINTCLEDEFRKDVEAALTTKNSIEENYNRNCRPQVDYGKWGRPNDKRRLSDAEQILLRKLLASLEEPVFVLGHKFSNYRSAVTTLQSIPLDRRDAIFAGLREQLEDGTDGEPLTERDEGVQFE